LVTSYDLWPGNREGLLWKEKKQQQPFCGSLDFVWDNPSKPVPEEKFTHACIHARTHTHQKISKKIRKEKEASRKAKQANNIHINIHMAYSTEINK